MNRTTRWMGALGLCAALCGLAAEARAGEANLGRLLAARLFRPQDTQGAARSFTRRGDTIQCVAFLARESHQRGAHIFACATIASGEVAGAVLSSKGRPRCDIAGTVGADPTPEDPNRLCGSVSICDASYDFCL